MQLETYDVCRLWIFCGFNGFHFTVRTGLLFAVSAWVACRIFYMHISFCAFIWVPQHPMLLGVVWAWPVICSRLAVICISANVIFMTLCVCLWLCDSVSVWSWLVSLSSLHTQTVVVVVEQSAGSRQLQHACKHMYVYIQSSRSYSRTH